MNKMLKKKERKQKKPRDNLKKQDKEEKMNPNFVNLKPLLKKKEKKLKLLQLKDKDTSMKKSKIQPTI